MPFCPKCRAEYEYGFAKCADCDIPLLNQLPKDSDEEENKLVPIWAITNELEGVLLCDLLKQTGIEADFWPFGTLLYGTPETNKAWGQVWVLDKDAETAKQIIEDYFKNLKENQEMEKEQEENTNYKPFLPNIFYNGPDRRKKQRKKPI